MLPSRAFSIYILLSLDIETDIVIVTRFRVTNGEDSFFNQSKYKKYKLGPERK